ncbi:hypothetical protein L226DRAFT_149690 [Lentinus tigrinus ALCF2SS1-7]|uniref:uncharacterized protein n=1 Tax=Lentinus tigrinus ALCF2SS1-7 TaxID=1328758 RepID=UPI001166404C|nr:hypothetical protein L226DRAFT_149690 [Lentinus tigrinus ALCF2SS1-7]
MNRSYRFIILDSAYLTWTLRCETIARIDNNLARWRSSESIARCWLKGMENSMRVDWIITSDEVKTSVSDKRSERVHKTWDPYNVYPIRKRSFVLRSSTQPKDLLEAGVLVGTLPSSGRWRGAPH